MSTYTQYLKAKAIRTGCDWKLKIKITSPEFETFPATARFSAQIRDDVEGPVKATLSSVTGTITRIDGNTIELWLKAAQSADWQEGTVIMDVIRTDLTQLVHLGFDLTIPVRRTITRL